MRDEIIAARLTLKESIMPYGKFESVSEVARIFDIEVSGNKPFIDKLKIEIPKSDFKRIEKKLGDDLNFINETTICT